MPHCGQIQIQANKVINNNLHHNRDKIENLEEKAFFFSKHTKDEEDM